MAVDVEGNLTRRRGERAGPGPRRRGVLACRRELAFVPTADNPTNLAFGRGEARRTLYVTARANLFRIGTLCARRLSSVRQVSGCGFGARQCVSSRPDARAPEGRLHASSPARRAMRAATVQSNGELS